MKHLNKILIFSFLIVLAFAALSFKFARAPKAIIEKPKIQLNESRRELQKPLNNGKGELLKTLVGSHSLSSISAMMGANTMSNYTLEKGKWKANSSFLSMGQREVYDLPLETAAIKTLNGLKITVEPDLSVSLTLNGKKYFNSTFNEFGLNYQLKSSPKDYFQFPEGFSAKTIFAEGYLYIFAADKITDSETSFADFLGVMRDAAIIRYNVEQKKFELLLFGEECCDSATLSF